MTKRICIIDGQGGGIGSVLIKSLRERYGESLEILALGTNAIATSQMMKARANRGATGENAVVRSVPDADLIIGPISITWAHAMMGEITPRMAEAVMSCSAPKILIPLSREKVVFVGLSGEPLPHLVEDIVNNKIKEFI
ncbi:MAG: DUF3842 family protein [Deltaproteobacteria bacterium]|nr:DUF3842 family protein [Deltaproteobacteria bacterium]MBW2140807.1 DUF3842 family protein [Deltaproteobacteria bacterium]MBW2324455.1 DUF3842 family protein [Deltaproteobacteria bacterium]